VGDHVEVKQCYWKTAAQSVMNDDDGVLLGCFPKEDTGCLNECFSRNCTIVVKSSVCASSACLGSASNTSLVSSFIKERASLAVEKF
jgi:hypothetical protein